MAKSNCKKRKLSLNQREKLIFLFIIISLTNKKRMISWFLELEKWVLEVLKEHSIYPNGSKIVVK
jgi:hypothetical protein